MRTPSWNKKVSGWLMLDPNVLCTSTMYFTSDVHPFLNLNGSSDETGLSSAEGRNIDGGLKVPRYCISGEQKADTPALRLLRCIQSWAKIMRRSMMDQRTTT